MIALFQELIWESAGTSMKLSLFKFFVWTTCSVAVGAALLAASEPASASAEGVLAVPEPAVLLLLGVGLTAIAVRVRSRRRS